MYENSCISLVETGVWKISTVSCGFSAIKSIILITRNRINEVYVFSI